MVATLLGGFWLGSLASVLSGFLAWWSFMPPPFGFSFYGAQVTSLLAFLLVCAVAALNSAVDMTDIAQIWHGYSDPATKMFRVNGKPTIGIGVNMRSGGNNLTFGEGLHRAAERLMQRLPVRDRPEARL